MSDTFGSLIDKLFTVDMKMWNNQEFLYEIRKMSFDEYKQKYFITKSERTDPKNRTLKWNLLFPRDYRLPFFMTYFNTFWFT